MMGRHSVFGWGVCLLSGCGLLLILLRPDPRQPDVELISHGASNERLSTGASESATTTLPPRLHFTTVAPPFSGVDFVYAGSPTARHHLVEQNGGGLAVLDADADGNADLFCVNGSLFDKTTLESHATNRLFRGSGDFRFRDVTVASGLERTNFGQGCTAGDFDNDGFTDLFVCCYGPNHLWKNNGDGTYTDVTRAAGVTDSRFASSAAFADLDDDGNLDLYVVNYLNWQPDEQARDRIQSPMDFSGQSDLLYHNNGNGQFRETGQAAGIASALDGKGLAVAIADLDADGRADIYVANDTTRNFLFRNTGGLQFEEVGVPSGAAVSQDGGIGSSMGVAISDYNRDGKPDLFITNFAQEVVDVLTNMGDAGYMATNSELGVDRVSRSVLNFGIVCTDFDLDLWPDLFFANGHLWDETPAGGQYAMLPSLLINDRGQRFHDVSEQAGDYFQNRWRGRAVAMGDLDNDGDTDLVVSHLGQPTGLLQNTSERQGNSRRVKLIGTRSSRQPLGCAVRIETDAGLLLTLQVPSGGSFQASHDPVLIVPTGRDGGLKSIDVHWAQGEVERWIRFSDAETIVLIQGRSSEPVSGSGQP